MYYFASDVHLGSGTPQESREREALFIKWLDRVSSDAKIIFLCGDIFDFWFEYRKVAPKGFVRTLGKIAQLTDSGIRVVFIAGNHDMWCRDYFATECGVEIYHGVQHFVIGGKRVTVAHGDNLNIGKNATLKILNTIFRSRGLKFLFSWLIHPDIALKFGQWWSGSSRKKSDQNELEDHLGVEQLMKYAANRNVTDPADYYIFGHMHRVKEQHTDSYTLYIMNEWAKDPHYIAINDCGQAEIKRVISQ